MNIQDLNNLFSLAIFILVANHSVLAEIDENTLALVNEYQELIDRDGDNTTVYDRDVKQKYCNFNDANAWRKYILELEDLTIGINLHGHKEEEIMSHELIEKGEVKFSMNNKIFNIYCYDLELKYEEQKIYVCIGARGKKELHFMLVDKDKSNDNVFQLLHTVSLETAIEKFKCSNTDITEKVSKSPTYDLRSKNDEPKQHKSGSGTKKKCGCFGF